MSLLLNLGRAPAAHPCTAQPEDADSVVSVQSVTLLAGRQVIRLANGIRGTMVTAKGKANFILRRRKNLPADQCPLLCFDVVCLDAVGRRGRESRTAPTKAAARAGRIRQKGPAS